MNDARYDFTNRDGFLNVYTVVPVEKFLCEQLDKGVDIYKADLRKLLKPLNNEQREYAIKQIRRFRSIHKLKNNLKTNQEYEKYKKILTDFSKFDSQLLARELELNL